MNTVYLEFEEADTICAKAQISVGSKGVKAEKLTAENQMNITFLVHRNKYKHLYTIITCGRTEIRTKQRGYSEI